MREGRRDNKPGSSMESQTSRSSRDDCDLAVQREDILEVLEFSLRFCFGVHLG